MKRFLELLETHKRIERRTADWDQKIGAELRAALVAEGVLDQAPRAKRFPCDNAFDGCPRHVHRGGPRDRTPYVAVCGAGTECEDVGLTDDDVEQLGWSFSAFVDLLRKTLAVIGAGNAPPVSVGTYMLGTIEREDRVVDVLLALDASSNAFEHFLASRSARPALVVVAGSRHVRDALFSAHGPGARVELVRLEDVLRVRDGRITVRSGFSIASREPISPAVPAPSYVVITPEGTRGLTQSEYQALVARAAEFDLFIDAATPLKDASGRKLRYRVLRRTRSGQIRESSLIDDVALAFVELMERRGLAIEPRALASLAKDSSSKRAAMKRLQAAREVVDERPFSIFKHDPSTFGDALAYRFAPPPTLRFVAIRARDERSSKP